MNKDYIDPTTSFVERFELESKSDTVTVISEEEIHAKKVHRSSIIFWSFIAFLATCPFALTGILVYTLGRYDQVIGSGGLEFLSEALSNKEISQLSSETGLPEIKFFVSIYDNRLLIIGLIFTFFISTISLLIFLRGLYYYLRNRNNE